MAQGTRQIGPQLDELYQDDPEVLAYLDEAIGPRMVGGVYHCGYWNEDYTVVSINRQGSWSITVRWLRDGHVTTHCTAWAPDRDRVVSQPTESPYTPQAIEHIMISDARSIVMEIAAEAETIINGLTYDSTFMGYNRFTWDTGVIETRSGVPLAFEEAILRMATSRVKARLGF